MPANGSVFARPHATLAVDRYTYAADVLRELAPGLPSPAVFDVGAGDSRMRHVVNHGLQWRGFDRQAWAHAEAWDLDKPPPTADKAGAVLLLDVIEHCSNPALALQNLSAAMLPGAVLILTTPNPRWSGNRVNTFARGVPSGFAQGDLDENHHVFVPLQHVIEYFLARAGLTPERYVTLDGATNPFRRRLSAAFPLQFGADLVRVALEATDAHACGMSYAVVARKR